MVALAAGCVLKSPPDTAALKADALPAVQVPPAWTATATGSVAAADNWLASFADPQLTAAVDEAMVHNADLRVGAARVEQSLLQARLAGARLYPSVDVLARGGGKMSGDNSGLSGVALTIGWEVDLGRVRYGRAAARADAASTQGRFRVRAAVDRRAGAGSSPRRRLCRPTSLVARSATPRGWSGSPATAPASAWATKKMFAARAAVGTYRDSLREIELAREQAIRALETLLGRYPAGAVTPQLPTQSTEVPAGLPSQLLERRLDVIAAERRGRGSTGSAKEGGATAGDRPHGRREQHLERSFRPEDRDNPIWNLGANLLIPIFKGGAPEDPGRDPDGGTETGGRGLRRRRPAGVQRGRAALSAELAARDRERILTETLADNRRALEIVQSQFAVGSTDLRFVTQRQLGLPRQSRPPDPRPVRAARTARVNLHLARQLCLRPHPKPVSAPRPSAGDLRCFLLLPARHIRRLRGQGQGSAGTLHRLRQAEEQLFLDLEEPRSSPVPPRTRRSRRRTSTARPGGSARAGPHAAPMDARRAAAGIRRGRGATAPASSHSAAAGPGETRTCRVRTSSRAWRLRSGCWEC